MRSNHATPRRALKLNHLLARALPFERPWIRFALCLWLLSGIAAASWALMVSRPATENMVARSAYLFDLENNLDVATAQTSAYDIAALRDQAAAAKLRLYPDRTALDRAIVAVAETLKAKSWNAVVAAVERDEDSHARLAFASYQLELKKVANGRRPEDADTSASVSAEALSFLQSVAAASGAIDIDHFEIMSEDGQFATIFVTLAAATAK